MRKSNLLAVFVIFVSFVVSVSAATTIDPANPYAYGANIGWINAEGDITHGAVIGQAFCSGYIYSANCGWISLGDGSPTDGMGYANNSAGDFGINHDGVGNLSGYAYGANIGWITFEQIHGQPKVNLITGDLSGYAWSANAGWINLDGIKTLSIDAGPDIDADNIPDAWEYGHTNTLTALNGGDADGDGVSDVDEYLADTDPFDDTDYLSITEFQVNNNTNEVTWPVKITRQYTLQHATALSNGTSWAETVTPFIPASGPDVTKSVVCPEKIRFYRIKSAPPLAE